MPLLKPVDDVNEILNYKDVARSLSYFIYVETQLPKFLTENQSKYPTPAHLSVPLSYPIPPTLSNNLLVPACPQMLSI